MDNMPQLWPWDQIDENKALAQLKIALTQADDGELFFERRRSESISIDDRRIRNANFSQAEGFGLRAVKDDFAAYAHSNDLSLVALGNAVGSVCATLNGIAKPQPSSASAAPSSLSPLELYGRVDPSDGILFEQKVSTLQALDEYARQCDPRVTQVQASLASVHQEVAILTPQGQLLRDYRPMVRISVQVIVQSNARREVGSSGGGGRYSLLSIMDEKTWKGHVDEALRIALVNLGAEDCPAGQQDIVIGAGWPGILLHEAIGHGLEGDAHRKETSVFTGKLGQRIAASGVNVYDDGTVPSARGSLHFDDEGSITQKTALIEDGILVGLMQDRQNARLMGVEPTGNGRRESYQHLPMPRMTNTYMSAGTASTDDFIADMKNGIYAVGFGGGQVDITSGKFVFSCTEAYRVENGRLGTPLKGATLIGDGATALRNIRAIGNNFSLDPGIGTCGKNGQWVPVTVGQPSLYITGLTVGGTA